MNKSLAIIMPVYNEEECVGQVFEEWIPSLDKLNIQYEFLAIDDGSKDGSLEILKNYASKHPGKIHVHHHSNRGHGQSCVAGYKMALSRGAEYIMQIDSDGQCDAQYMQEFWAAKDQAPVMGYRTSRADGQSRWWISRIVSLVGFLGTGIWVKDLNVPYRLMTKDQLAAVIDKIPPDFHLANILLSLRLRQKNRFKWIQIHFRDRFGGTPSIKTFNFAKQGLKLLIQLWQS